jgi:hypothetical protein
MLEAAGGRKMNPNTYFNALPGKEVTDDFFRYI